jgi:uncharacterized PurR-regulated membrane protein YhhQ (DUF165 family)
MAWIATYLLSVVGINIAFSYHPELDWIWSVFVGLIFIFRDMVQRRIGHWSLAIMAIALVISYLMADPVVALASASAFAASETTDWLVFTVTRRPLADRLFLSSSFSIPIDTAIFFGMIGVFEPSLWVIAILSKFSGVFVVWVAMRYRGPATA